MAKAKSLTKTKDKVDKSDPTSTKSAKVDKLKIVELAEKKLTYTDIGKTVGCTEGYVRKVLKQAGEFRAEVKKFRDNRANHFATLQEKSIQALAKMLDWVIEQDMSTLSEAQKPKYIQAITNLMGVMYDKERLETGQSTSNVQSLLIVSQGDVEQRVQSALSTPALDIQSKDDDKDSQGCQDDG